MIHFHVLAFIAAALNTNIRILRNPLAAESRFLIPKRPKASCMVEYLFPIIISTRVLHRYLRWICRDRADPKKKTPPARPILVTYSTSLSDAPVTGSLPWTGTETILVQLSAPHPPAIATSLPTLTACRRKPSAPSAVAFPVLGCRASAADPALSVAILYSSSIHPCLLPTTARLILVFHS